MNKKDLPAGGGAVDGRRIHHRPNFSIHDFGREVAFLMAPETNRIGLHIQTSLKLFSLSCKKLFAVPITLAKISRS
jgi:hypothetical protein